MIDADHEGAMKHVDKKAAVAAYKDSKRAAGVYAIRCAASGEVWVGQGPNVEPVKNRVWFTLRGGNSPHRSLQKAWNDHGGESFAFEVLERVEEEASPYLLDGKLKERASHCRSALKAQSL